MVSVIVCSRRVPADDLHHRNVQKTASAPVEYIRIDNREKPRGICAVYNQGIARACGDILVFMHEDAFFMEPGWDQVLQAKFSADPDLGLVGVAGTQYLFADDVHWHLAGPPFTRGRVVHELDGGKKYLMTVFSADRCDAEVVVVDGLFLALRGDLATSIGFDEQHFPDFHFYDLDLCMQVRKTHRCLVTWDLLIKHFSAGHNDPSWHTAARAFMHKYADCLPAFCTERKPDRTRLAPVHSYDLRGRASPGVIA